MIINPEDFRPTHDYDRGFSDGYKQASEAAILVINMMADKIKKLETAPTLKSPVETP